MTAMNDTSSCSNTDKFVVSHYAVDWTVNMSARSFVGNAILTVKTVAAAAQVSLDVLALEIESVEAIYGESREAVTFKVLEFVAFGKQLLVDVREQQPGSEFKLAIKYQTTPEGPSLCWLDPAQTSGKTQPFVFSQGQACLNRSLLPCQDSPSVRATYEAVVSTPKAVVPAMSARCMNPIEDNRVVGDAVEGDANMHQFRFEMPFTIPIYLMAINIGDLRCADIGPRSRVWAEPCLLDAATYEFSDSTEEYVATAERLFGPYRWERYDIIVMPKCYPFGGMENPMLTSVTPCLLAGDRSLVDVVAHEIAHSWFGNLTTNATWADFFMNEGFTMYAQRRITQEVNGRAFTALEATTGQALLKQNIDDLGLDSPITCLHVPMEKGVDPEDCYAEPAYEKGYCFVSYLRNAVGTDEKFDEWLTHYTTKFAFHCVTPEGMLECFFEYFPELKGLESKEGLEFTRWLNEPGMPLWTPDLSEATELTVPSIDVWPTYQVLHFLDTLVEAHARVSPEALEQLSEAYSFGDKLVGRCSWEPGFASVQAFLQSQGKQKYTLPVYRALMAGNEAAKALASESFKATAPELHVIVRNYVREITGATA